MRLFLVILMIAAFIQSSFLPLNLVLLLLFCRALVVDESSNYYYGFVGGIILGILSIQNIGFWPVVFLMVIKIASMVKKLPLSTNILVALPAASLIIIGVAFVQKIVFGQAIDFSRVAVEAALVFPLYIFMSFWEDRLRLRGDIRLRLRN